MRLPVPNVNARTNHHPDLTAPHCHCMPYNGRRTDKKVRKEELDRRSRTIESEEEQKDRDGNNELELPVRGS